MTVRGPDPEATAWEIRRGEPDDADALRAIREAKYGTLDVDARWLDEALGDDEDVVAFVAVDADDDPVGYSVVGLFDPDYCNRVVRGVYPVEEFPERTAIIDMVAVDGDWQKEGVASGVSARAIEWATGRSPLMVVVTWRRPDHYDSGDLAEKFGHREVARIEGYYRDLRSFCPDCGDTCTCAASVHVRPLGE